MVHFRIYLDIPGLELCCINMVMTQMLWLKVQLISKWRSECYFPPLILKHIFRIRTDEINGGRRRIVCVVCPGLPSHSLVNSETFSCHKVRYAVQDLVVTKNGAKRKSKCSAEIQGGQKEISPELRLIICHWQQGWEWGRLESSPPVSELSLLISLRWDTARRTNLLMQLGGIIRVSSKVEGKVPSIWTEMWPCADLIYPFTSRNIELRSFFSSSCFCFSTLLLLSESPYFDALLQSRDVIKRQ